MDICLKCCMGKPKRGKAPEKPHTHVIKQIRLRLFFKDT